MGTVVIVVKVIKGLKVPAVYVVVREMTVVTLVKVAVDSSESFYNSSVTSMVHHSSNGSDMSP